MQTQNPKCQYMQQLNLKLRLKISMLREMIQLQVNFICEVVVLSVPKDPR